MLKGGLARLLHAISWKLRDRNVKISISGPCRVDKGQERDKSSSRRLRPGTAMALSPASTSIGPQLGTTPLGAPPC
jgi:hypothetical protein